VDHRRTLRNLPILTQRWWTDYVYERQSNDVRDIKHLVLSSVETRWFSIGNHCTTAAHIKADTQKACYSRSRNNVLKTNVKVQTCKQSLNLLNVTLYSTGWTGKLVFGYYITFYQPLTLIRMEI
jgi:hypothetical protein